MLRRARPACKTRVTSGRSAIPLRRFLLPDHPMSRVLSSLFLVLAVLAASSGALFAAEAAPAREPRIGLVLGGGGARGAAHVGVLKVLEQERVPIHAIAGTSMGAIVGSLYASGYSADEIEALLGSLDYKDYLSDEPDRRDLPMRRKEQDFRDLLDFELGFRDGRIQFPRGFLQGQKFLTLMRRMTLPVWHVEDFDDLPIPFRAVGTDIGRGQRVVFEQGDLALAVRASMAVPGAFAPIRVDGRLMVDGGLVDNLPVDIVREMGVDRVIVVDVSGPLMPESELNSPIAVSLQMITVLMQQRTDQTIASLRSEDLLIRPNLEDVGSSDFNRAPDAIRLGERAADAMRAQIATFALPEAEYAAVRARQARPAFEKPLISWVDVSDTRTRTPGHVSRLLADQEGQPLDVDAVEHRLARAYGAGSYERILYRIGRRDEAFGLRVTPVDKGWGPNYIGFGLQINDDFSGRSDYQIAAEATFTGLNRWGAEARARIDLGRNAGFSGEWYQPFGRNGQFYVLPGARVSARNQPVLEGLETAAEYRFEQSKIGIEAGWHVNDHLTVFGELERGRTEAQRLVGNPDENFEFGLHFGSVGLGARYDTLDDAFFPSRGARGAFSATAFRETLGTENDGEVVAFEWNQAFSRGRYHGVLGVSGQTEFGEPDAFESLATLGGLAQLSGYGERELVGRHSALARAVFFRRFGDMSQLVSVPAYIGFSLESGNTWAERDDIGIDSMIVAGSAFVGVSTPLGPVFLGYGYAETGASSYYLNFGSLFGGRR